MSTKKTADLHIHTSFSDGRMPPAEVVSRAIDLELSAIAITDHDCVEGIKPAIEAAINTPLEIIPGVELSAAIEDIEIHLLGYFIDYKNKALVKQLSLMKSNREERIRGMLDLLHSKGINLPYERVFGSNQTGTIGRLHLAHIMVEEGIVKKLKDAFDKYIGDSKACYVKYSQLDYSKAISLIRNAGGVPVLAHPGTKGKDEYIACYIESGLRGIEAMHSRHYPRVKDKYSKIAEEQGLIITGGSDCHGIKDNLLMGKIHIGYDVVEKLRIESEKIKKSRV